MRRRYRILSLLLSLVVIATVATIRAQPAACTDGECDIRCTCSAKGNATCPGAGGTGCSTPLCEKIWLGE